MPARVSQVHYERPVCQVRLRRPLRCARGRPARVCLGGAACLLSPAATRGAPRSPAPRRIKKVCATAAAAARSAPPTPALDAPSAPYVRCLCRTSRPHTSSAPSAPSASSHARGRTRALPRRGWLCACAASPCAPAAPLRGMSAMLMGGRVVGRGGAGPRRRRRESGPSSSPSCLATHACVKVDQSLLTAHSILSDH